jgi:hypothetical protein
VMTFRHVDRDSLLRVRSGIVEHAQEAQRVIPANYVPPSARRCRSPRQSFAPLR